MKTIIIQAELIEWYKITIGDDGCSRGCYVGDEWEEVLYGGDITELARQFSIKCPYGLPKMFTLQKVESLKFEGTIYTHKELECYSGYGSDKQLVAEHALFFDTWNSEELKTQRANAVAAIQAEQKTQEELKEKENREKKEKQDYEIFLKLKQKFDSNPKEK